MIDQETQALMLDYDEPDEAPRHACWLITFADGTCQRIGSWPPLSRVEVMRAYRCVDATLPKEKP